ncbi:hypothetical protein EPD60_16645 [Flaviaesturariibacter flavus]|uniref:OmpA-like domain-containing protein n=1 Tax=Flaviaesturariibacter flavus TaxID=2502780 RepID=A0A4R1B290_9BACT|nr:OmpA family protein [Flaviaesturariibacter flavus]TCJ12172.1 hypothetical protein EPD60_16645 [Flaviaesturariibacter flavus]
MIFHSLKTPVVVLGTLLLASSCASSKKLKQKDAEYNRLNGFYEQVQADLRKCRDEADEIARRRNALEQENRQLRDKAEGLKESSNVMVSQLRDLSVISGAQAESIRRSLENLGAKDAYINDLQQAMSRKDSLHALLVSNLKSALSDVNDQDIEIKVDKGVVFVSISDKLLFNSGSYTVTARAMSVLQKVAQVLNSRPDIEFLVEGHTDNVTIRNTCIADNWDLSTKRATSVVRLLQTRFGIAPRRMTAGGRGEYLPAASNASAAGKAANRRTRIVILPQLDQFFQLLEK